MAAGSYSSQQEPDVCTSMLITTCPGSIACGDRRRSDEGGARLQREKKG